MYLFQAVGPVDKFQSVEQTLGVGGDTQRPLAHQLAFHGIAAADGESAHHLVVGKHGAQLGTPVYGYVGKVGQTVVHQRLLTFLFGKGVPLFGGDVERFAAGGVEAVGAVLREVFLQIADRQGFVGLVAVVAVEQLDKSPLCPFVIFWITGAYLAAPVEGESYFVELFAVACNILFGGDGGGLTGLYGVLFGGQAVGVVAHGVQHVETFQAFVACKDVAGYVSEGVSHMQSRSRGVGEHVEDVVFGFVGDVVGAVGLIFAPVVLPFAFDVVEIVIHIFSIKKTSEDFCRILTYLSLLFFCSSMLCDYPFFSPARLRLAKFCNSCILFSSFNFLD